MSIWVVALASGVATWWLTGAVRQQALARRVLDVPTARSSHTVATPRGGGVAIIVVSLVAFSVLGLLGLVTPRQAVALIGGGLIAGGIGLLDDLGGVPPLPRLLVHFASAGWVLAFVGGVPRIVVLDTPVAPSWLLVVLTLLYLVWHLNLTNFMDGIDGIAGVQATTVCLGGAVASWLAPDGGTVWAPALVVGASTSGFLVWNWPPARIFMGDAGSGFLGLMIAAHSLLASSSAPATFWSWVILSAVFVADATVTLLRRLSRGEPVHEAHRSHAYQHTAQYWASHRRVTIAVAVINLVLLLPLALLVAVGALEGLVGVAVAYVPLVIVAWKLGAGRPSDAPPVATLCHPRIDSHP